MGVTPIHVNQTGWLFFFDLLIDGKLYESFFFKKKLNKSMW